MSNINEQNNNSGEITPDMLKYVLDNDILDISYIQEQMEMTKRSETLSKHPYAISKGKDGYFRTYIPDLTRKDNRRLIKKKCRKDLEDEVIDYWREKEEYSFLSNYNEWVSKQEMYGVVNNTLLRYESDYRRFFQGTEFEKMDIRKMTEEDITAFMIKTIKNLELRERAGNTLWGYISGTFK